MDESEETKKIRHTKAIVSIISTSLVSAAGIGIGCWLIATGNIPVGASLVSSIVGFNLPSPYEILRNQTKN